MTGICDADDRYSPTIIGYRVPSCYWKLICYVDPQGETQVVGYIGNNTLINYCSGCDVDAKAERTADTITTRDQRDILAKIYSDRTSFVLEAWMGAETYLLVNRNETRAPRGADCWAKMSVSDSVKNEWNSLLRQDLREQEFTEDIDFEKLEQFWK
jgi:hypothetical protein